MKIIVNKYIPFKGFVCINLFGIFFVRDEYKNDVSDVTINHEKIHTEQMKEMLYIFFYIWYAVEWLIKYFICFNDYAYYSISFEQEAYANDTNFKYLSKRKKYSWLKYVFKKWK